jgi:hypothetical protein
MMHALAREAWKRKARALLPLGNYHKAASGIERLGSVSNPSFRRYS